MHAPEPGAAADGRPIDEPGPDPDLGEGLSTDPSPDPDPDLPGDEGVDAELGDDPGSGGD